MCTIHNADSSIKVTVGVNSFSPQTKQFFPFILFKLSHYSKILAAFFSYISTNADCPVFNNTDSTTTFSTI